MSSQRAFDDLGRIISSGGIHSGARELSESGDPGLLVGWIVARWPGLSGQDVARLQQLIIESSSGASPYNQPPDDDSPSLSSIPIAPTALGADPEGNRFEVGFEVSYTDPSTGAEKTIYVKGAFPTLPSSKDLTDMGQDYIDNLFDMYPERFGLTEDSDPIEVSSVDAKSILRIY